MYVSPIEVTMKDLKESFDADILKVIWGYDINVDKEELVKALSYDRDQYNKGYEDAKKDVLAMIDNFISMVEYYHPDEEHELIPISEMKYRVNQLPYEKSDGWLEYFEKEGK